MPRTMETTTCCLGKGIVTSLCNSLCKTAMVWMLATWCPGSTTQVHDAEGTQMDLRYGTSKRWQRMGDGDDT